MIIITSLSPGHRNAENQIAAVESWKKLGCPIYSMNSAQEVYKLKDIYKGVEFIETHKTIYDLVKKPMVSINAMIDFAIEKDEDLCLINSDIILRDIPHLNMDGITLLVRHDYIEDMDKATVFPHGFDCFFIPKKFLKIFPPSIYAMGVSHWDHWIPLRAIQYKVPLYSHNGYIFHKWHETQYHLSEWEKIAEYFKWEFSWDKHMSGGQIATATMQKIKESIII